jgi:tetratricopeptide (TPR) repeat protein
MRIDLLLPTIFACLFAATLSLSGGDAFADDRERIEQAEAGILNIVKLAKEGRFAELEAKAAERKAYADANPDKDVSFGEIFNPFERADPDLAGPLKEWRAKYPDSFAPYMALGAYSTHIGWVVRGEGTVYETNPKRFIEMRRYLDEAVSALHMGIRHNPRMPRAWTHLIAIASATGDVAEVDSLFKEAIRYMPRSSYLYRTYYDFLAPKWTGSDAQQYALRFRIRGAFADDPRFGWIETVEDNDKAWDLFWHHDLKSALALFDKIIAVRPDYFSRYGRASTLHYLNRVDESIDAFHRVLLLSPGNAKIYARLAAVQMRRVEMKADAARNLDRALLFDPYDPEYLVQRARSYLDGNQPERAKRDLDKALLLGVYNDDVHNQLRRYYWTAGNMPKAIDEAEKMVTLMPTKSWNWFMYAITLKQNSDCRALAAFEHYLQQCLMNRECNEARQQEITLNIYNMKQACS